jgi:uncharacterized MnhB-related membrane protein
MATGFPASTGDVLSAAMFNGLVTFTANSQSGSTYTVANTDLYQALVITTNASTKTVTIAPDSTLTAAAVGSAITFLNTGAGDLTFSQGSGVTITSAGATSSAPKLGAYKSAMAIRTGANAWTVVGAVS